MDFSAKHILYSCTIIMIPDSDCDFFYLNRLNYEQIINMYDSLAIVSIRVVIHINDLMMNMYCTVLHAELFLNKI